MKELLALEHGWHQNHFGKGGLHYMLDLNSKHPSITLHQTAPKDFGRPVVSLKRIVNRNRAFVLHSKPIDGEIDHQEQEAYEGVIDPKFFDRVCHISGVTFYRNTFGGLALNLWAETLDGEFIGHLGFDFILFPRYLKFSRKSVRRSNWFTRLIGW